MAGELYPMPFKSVNGTTPPDRLPPWAGVPCRCFLAHAVLKTGQPACRARPKMLAQRDGWLLVLDRCAHTTEQACPAVRGPSMEAGTSRAHEQRTTTEMQGDCPGGGCPPWTTVMVDHRVPKAGGATRQDRLTLDTFPRAAGRTYATVTCSQQGVGRQQPFFF